MPTSSEETLALPPHASWSEQNEQVSTFFYLPSPYLNYALDSPWTFHLFDF